MNRVVPAASTEPPTMQSAQPPEHRTNESTSTQSRPQQEEQQHKTEQETSMNNSNTPSSQPLHKPPHHTDCRSAATKSTRRRTSSTKANQRKRKKAKPAHPDPGNKHDVIHRHPSQMLSHHLARLISRPTTRSKDSPPDGGSSPKKTLAHPVFAEQQRQGISSFC